MPDPASTPPLVGPLADADAPAVAATLAAAEDAVGGELVDEAERRRLDALADDPTARAARWHPLVATEAATTVGYGAVVLPEDATGRAVGDVAALPDATDRGAVLRALLAGLRDAAADGSGSLQVWLRRGDATDLEAAADAGFDVERRLGVLGRDLPVASSAIASRAPADVRIRAYRPDEDDDEVVRVLAAAYAGTGDAGWDLAAFRTKRGWDWFRPEDLLLAEDGDGRVLGLHWLKRRDATTGEVHNLAVDPAAQGQRVGPALLRAGLDHLTAVGCTDVVLWVDRVNDRAVRLYEEHGFTTRWDDVALRSASSPGGART